MSGAARSYLSASGLLSLRERLSVRDVQIISQVAELRLMSSGQIRSVHFPDSEHQSRPAAARACHRALQRLSHERLLTRLARRIGGVRAGSTSFVWALSAVGQRLLALGGARRRFHEPTSRFVDHTLAISQLVVEAQCADRRGELELLAYETEPKCWRAFTGMAGGMVLRPDLHLSLGVGDYKWRWFIEVDRGSVSLPVVIGKSRLYLRYYQSGQEQARCAGSFPRVCWVASDERRAEHIRAALARERDVPERLFTVTTDAHALAVLAGGAA